MGACAIHLQFGQGDRTKEDEANLQPHLSQLVLSDESESGGSSKLKQKYVRANIKSHPQIDIMMYSKYLSCILYTGMVCRMSFMKVGKDFTFLLDNFKVMSASVAAVMRAYGQDEMQETANFLALMDRFFDCLNVRSEKEGARKRKPDLLPFTDVDDKRFEVQTSQINTVKFYTERFFYYYFLFYSQILYANFLL